MRRLLAPLLLLVLLTPPAWAVDLCTIASVGGDVHGAANTLLAFTGAGFPATYHPGTLLMMYSGTQSSAGSSTTNPTGYTLLFSGPGTGSEVWGKIAGRSESDPGIQWNGKEAGFIVAVDNPAGWPALGSIQGDSATNGTTSTTKMEYFGLTVGQGGGCAFQAGDKVTTTNNVNTPTAVAVGSGYVAAGFATFNAVNSPTLGMQMYDGDATTPDLGSNSQTITGNTDSAVTNKISFTLLSGDNDPAAFTAFTDQTNATASQVYTHAATAVSGFDNWTSISVTGSTCEVNPGSTAWVTSGYINVAETFQVHGTAPAGAGDHLDCVVSLDGGTQSDTYTITTAAGDTDPAAFNFTGDVTLQELSVQSDPSNAITVTAIDSTAPIVIKAGSDTGCKYKINSGSYTTSDGTVSLNDTVTVVVTTSSSSATAKACNVTIGTISGTTDFTATTADFIPAAYDTFTDTTGVALNATSCSDAVALSGLTGGAAVSVDIGTCRVNSAGYTSTTCGTAGNTDTVQMCHTASGSYATDTTQTMSIGPTAVTATFKSTTLDAPSATESPLIFTDAFTGSNGTAITAHTPTLDVPGHGWTKVGAGVAEIQSNRLSLGQTTYAVVDTDATVWEADVDWVIPASSSQAVQIIARFTDTNNKFLCQYDEDLDQIFIRKRIASTNTTFVTTLAFPITENATHQIGIFTVGGDQIGCTLDGVAVASAIDAAANTVQGFALETITGTGGTPVATFDNLRIKHAYQGTRSDTSVVPDDPLGLFQGEATLSPLTYFWAKSSDLPDKTYAGWTLYEGGSFYYSPEVAFVGNDIWSVERWNPTTAALETSTLTYTTQGASLAAAVWQAAAINISLPIGVPASIDFTQYLTTRGVLAAVCSSNSDIGGMSFTDPANCIYSGTPNTGYTAPQSKTITATNITGAPTKAAVFTITGDDVPDFPAFTPVTAATPSASAVACSNTVTLTQTNIPFAITVAGDTGCKYVKDGGAASSAATTGVSGTTLALQVDAGIASSTKVCTATAGGISQSCTVTASPAVSSDVNDFTFASALNVALLSSQSSCATVDGNTALAAVTVTGGTCTIDGGTCPGNLPIGGGTVCALHTASATNATPTNTVVTVSNKQGTFTSVTTGVVPTYVAGCIVDSDYELLVGDSVTRDLSSCWTGAESITIQGDLPPDSSPGGECAVSGSSITCDGLTTEGTYITEVVVSNSQGIDIRYLNFDIQASDTSTPVPPHGPRRAVRH